MKKRTVLGLTEPVIMVGPDGKQKQCIARIDTGATKSSIDIGLAREMDLGPAQGRKLVKSTNGMSFRPVMKATVLLAGNRITQEFNVADRSHLRYRVLIGQNILRLHGFIIDPVKKK